MRDTDTTTEYYNRKGNLTRLVRYDTGTRVLQHGITDHLYKYDRKNRIVQEKTTTQQGTLVTRVEYDSPNNRAVIHNKRWRDDTITAIVNYNTKHEEISWYYVNLRGDTIFSCVRDSAEANWKTWKRKDDELVLQEARTMIVVSPALTTYQCGQLYGDGSWMPMRYEENFDSTGKLIRNVFYYDYVLDETYEYMYDDAGNLTREVRTNYYDEDTVVDVTEYVYVNGKLMETHLTNADDACDRSDTFYTYNEKGLLTEILHINFNQQDCTTKRWCERFEYGYY